MDFSQDAILFGKFRIEELVGHGAFAKVYRATHVVLGEQRALKVLNRTTEGLDSLAYEDFLSRFRMEARIGSQLANVPSVVSVYDVEQEGETLVLVLEYCPGGSLADKIAASRQKKTHITMDEVLRAALEIADGLAALHQLDAVHRDLKPSNILFEANGRANVADFGLVQISGGPTMRSQLSQTRPHPGTPGYMSPEQIQSSGLLTSASDIYAFGLILFETLTGVPYSTKRPDASLMDLRPDTPAWLDDLICQMLDQDKTKRPWNGEDVAHLLREGMNLAERKKTEIPVLPKLSEFFHRPEGVVELAEISISDMQEALENLLAEKKWDQAQLLLDEWKIVSPDDQTFAAYQSRINVALAYMRSNGRTLELAAGITMEFLKIPSGEFWMGSDQTRDSMSREDERPQHRVRLNEFWIGRFPVTNLQYEAFLNAVRKPRPAHWSGGILPAGKENHPVVHITWDEAQVFCRWLSQKSGLVVALPSEAQWEKAARGSDGRIYPWGSEPPDATRAPLGLRPTEISTTPVDAYSPQADSPFFCASMAGNVMEWTCSAWKSYPYFPRDGREDLTVRTERVLRGGSWFLREANLRSASRFHLRPEVHYKDTGMRCVCWVEG